MALAATVPFFFADYAGTLDVSNRTEVRGRSTQGATPDPSLDIVDTPTARIGLSDRRWDYTLGYSALGLLPDVEIAGPPELLQSVDLGAIWHDRRVRIGLAEYGQFGEQNSAYALAAPALTPGGTAPPVQGVQALSNPVTLYFGGTRTVLASEVTLARLWRATSSVEYDAQGGLDAASQLTLPVVMGPRADLSLTYTATRVDGFETKASALRSETSSGPCSPAILDVPAGATCAPVADSGQLTESWQRRLDRTTTVAVGAGASVSAVRLEARSEFVDLTYPVVLASLQENVSPSGGSALASPGGARVGATPTGGVVRGDFQLAPVLDLRTGILDERVQLTATAIVPVRKTTLSGLLGATRSVASPFIAPVTSVQGTLEAEQRLSPTVSAGGGVRYAWQEQDPFGTFSGGMLFVQVTVRAPLVRF